jgi:hypothetical protein
MESSRGDSKDDTAGATGSGPGAIMAGGRDSFFRGGGAVKVG